MTKECEKKDLDMKDLMKKSIKNPATNVQRPAYQVTINNPLDYGLDHKTIIKKVVEKSPTIGYICMADEIGKEMTPHTHVYLHFNSRVRWSTIKKLFPQAHIEVAHGTAESNLEYIKKTGRWENTEKAETRIEGSFEEWGTFPLQKGIKPDMEELYQMVKNGYSNSEILAINNDYILHIDKIDKLRLTLLMDKYKNERRLDLKVIYVSGSTGAGKTRDILDEYGDANVFRVNDYKNPFDSYNCQSVIVFDEYRSQFPIADMLQYCDVYAIELKARYANRYACYHTVYIVSNLSLEEQYKNVQVESPESWKAFLRRIHEVHVYNEDGRIDTYSSVKDYLHREESFKKVTEMELQELPF